jgi:hypothetical protein
MASRRTAVSRVWRGAEEIVPFDLAELTWSFQKILTTRSPRRLEDAVADVLRRYENRRQAGHHDGRPLAALRLYAESWHVDPDQGTFQAPTMRQLLIEVSKEKAQAWRR